ncbi:MAG: class I SAM-dependent methyltransferase [Deltaproteobacteria bacterium]|nr:class I SAM-dependent methyltransferase [Deltaproteobacteria bacterium]
MKKEKILSTIYPEYAAGGFARDDHEVLFYSRIRALLKPTDTVLDFGAGRGLLQDYQNYASQLSDLRQACAKVVGYDVDPEVKQNPTLSEVVLGSPGDPRLPFEDGSFDLIVSRMVFEHIEHPDKMLAEFHRVLKPGGWVCAMTPNKWGFVGILARVIPEQYHKFILKKIVKTDRTLDDIFPTYYRINSLASAERYLKEIGFENFSYVHSGPPAYFGHSLLAARVIKSYEDRVPASLGRAMHIFARKR